MNSNLKSNFLFSVGYKVLAIIIPIITTPYLSRIFGASGIGEFTYAYAISQYFSLVVLLGLNNYGTREVSVCRKSKEKLSQLFSDLYLMQFCLGIIMISCYLLYCKMFSDNLISYLFLIYIISSVIDVNWLFFGLEQFKITVLRNCVVKLITTISIFIFVKDTGDLNLYILIIVLGSLVSQLMMLPFLKKILYFRKPILKNTMKHIKPNFILFIPIIGVSIYNMMDKIMVGMITNSIEVGLYESADKIKTIPITFISALGTVILPRISFLYSENNNSVQIKNLINKSMLYTLFLTSSLSFGVMSVSNEFIILFFGEGFEKVKLLFYFLMPSTIFIGVENIIKTLILIPMKKDEIYIHSILYGAILNLVLNFFLIRMFGALGAAIATLLTEIFVCFYQIWKIRYIFDICKILIKNIIFIISGIVMYFIVANLKFDSLSLLLNLVFKILIGVMTYVLAVIIGFFVIQHIKRKDKS